MKNLSMLVWVAQLGLSVAVPPAVWVLLALWLRDGCGWGAWVLWAGIVLGFIGAADGLRVSLKAMERLSKDKKRDGEPPVCFNDHD